ncbi:MAG: AI-2E family transporter [bacterium]|nr:AI-2E family transporter [bacterium]MDA1024680.1 AI-2E family transporter [bacterium]
MSVKPMSIEITTGTVWRVIGVLLFVAALWFLRDIVLVTLAGLLLAALIDPIADRFEQRGVKRGLTVLGVYAIIALFVALISWLVVPVLIQESEDLVTRYGPVLQTVIGESKFIERITSGEFFAQDPIDIFRSIQNAGIARAIPDIVNFFVSAFAGILAVIYAVVLAYYIVVEDKAMRHGIAWLAPKQHRERVKQIIPQVRRKLGEWLQGQLLIMFFIFLISLIGFSLIGLPFSLILAIMAGLLEVVPFLGPLAAGIPAIIIGLSVSPLHGLLAAVVALLIQQIEGQILSPKIMHRVTGLNPVVTLLVVVVGFELVGLMGALLAIPVTVAVWVIMKETRAL